MATLHYYFYKTATGEIVKQVSGDLADDPSLVSRNTEAGESSASSVINNINNETQYYPSGVLTTRPILSDVITFNKTSMLADQSDKIIITGIPNPSIINITSNDGGVGADNTTITDGIVEFITKQTGSHIFIFNAAFPYQIDYTVTIEAT